jgi:sugar O-acyltransferase (sialic acid O-acetyltransferase NeuD family)
MILNYNNNEKLFEYLSLGKKICIVGIGGFGREVLCCIIDILRGTQYDYLKCICFMTTDKIVNEFIMQLPVLSIVNFNNEEYVYIISVGNPKIRKKVVESFPTDTKYITIIHPSVVMSEWVEIGEGSIVTANVILTCNIKIGKHAHLNLHTTIGHDCIIGDYFTTAPAVNISGICMFGNCVYFGTNVSVKQGITIVDDVIIGMGGVVVKDIEECGTYIGMPVKRIIF